MPTVLSIPARREGTVTLFMLPALLRSQDTLRRNQPNLPRHPRLPSDSSSQRPTASG
ncbi:hypothetical protein BJV78DRAFT_1244846 [Lactifluus subvellereus]|nr:hypothetical protein BJV78DRAFT_1244846 [Lactifluus subvellereus]